MHRGFNKNSNGIPRNEAGYVKNSRFCFLNAFTSVFTQTLLAVMMKLQCDLRRNVTPYDGFFYILYFNPLLSHTGLINSIYLNI